MEHKSIEFELKADPETEGVISGYGSVYGNKDQGGDILVKGAFDKSLKSGRKVKMLWQHDPNVPIGVWDKFESDERGLKAEGRLLLDIPQAKTAYSLIKAEAIDGLSIGYRTIDFSYTGKGNERTRELKEVDLWELSIVTFPMNTEATVTDVKQLGSPREVEQILRKAGVPGAFAKLVALHGYEEAVERLEYGRREGDEGLAELVNGLKKLKEAIHA